MEKEALIDIILNDLNEMQTLVSTFKGKTVINSAFIKLAHTKLNNIGEELNLLDSLKHEQESQSILTETSLTSSSSIPTPKEDGKKIAESSKQLMTEEAETELIPEPVKETPKKEEAKLEDVKVANEIPKPAEVVEPPKAKNIPPPKKETVLKSEGTIIGEKINTEKKSVNERISVNKEPGNSVTQIGKAVDDVKKAIGLNDRFYFQRELFQGNADLFNQTLDQLNQLESYDSAVQFLQSNYNWGDENEVAESFLKNIKRRFI